MVHKIKSCIIVANGDRPSKRNIEYLLKHGVSTIIAADGGANSCFKLGIVPKYIIGDFDSIKPKVLCYYENRSKLIRYKRQNDTDVEKALKLAVKKKYETVYLLGGTGNRLDHSICNLGFIIKYFSKIRILIIHGKTVLFPYWADVKLESQPGETVSLYAFNSNTRITSSGLKYPLRDASLPFGEKESTSNVALSDFFELKISGGIVFVIRELKKMKYDGLILKS